MNSRHLRKEKKMRNESKRKIRIGGWNLDLSRVEFALLEHPSVEECAVLARATEQGRQELVAYTVLSGPFSTKQLNAHLKAFLPEGAPVCSFVPVSTLPLTATGQVDEQALVRLEVIDSDLVREWEEQLRSVSGVKQIAAVVREGVEPVPPLHLSDLLPDWGPVPQIEAKGLAATQVAPDDVPQKTEARRLSVSDGGPLREVPGTRTTLPGSLQLAVKQSPEKGIVYIEPDESETFQSYPDLLVKAEQILAGLRKLGLKPEDKVIFQFECNQDFISVFWGCILGGIIPVPIGIAPTYTDVNSAVNKLHNAWLMLNHPLILTSNALAPSIRSLSDLLNLEDFRVETIDELLANEPDRDWHETKPNDFALMMLTSGSTGAPKGVMLNHQNLLSRSVGSVQMNGFSNQDITLNWMPLDHVAGIIYFHLRDVFLGCKQVHGPAEMILEDPLRWLDWIERYRATITFAPNFAFGLVNQCEEEIGRRNWDLSSMKYLLNGAEAIVAKTARRFVQLLLPHGLPNTAMHPAWGMSETSSGVVYSDRFSLDRVKDDDSFVEVGAPIPGFSMRIVEDQGNLVEEGEIGRLQVMGHTVTAGYYNNPKVNAEAFTDDGWFDTGDLGFLREGRLTITGREKDVIIINSVNYYSHEIEGVVEEVEGVETSFTAACSVRDPNIDTDKLAIFFHPLSSDDDDLRELLKEIRKHVIKRIGVSPSYLIPVERQDIPKTEIGKIQRPQLSKRFQEGEFNKILKRIDLLSGNENTIPNWFFEKVWRRNETPTENKQALRGSSLIFVDQLGLGAHIYEEMSKLNQSCVRVEAGSDFAKLAFDSYRINPKNAEDYRRLLETLLDENIRIDRIFHLWTYDEYAGEPSSLEELERAQDLGVYSLLFLIQAMAKFQGDGYPVHLLVVSSYTHPILMGDQVAYEKSPILGLIKTAPQEMPWLNCRCVDLLVDDPDVNLDLILKEIQTLSRDAEVAYRNGQRYVPRLRMGDLTQREKQDLPFKKGGMYLLTGALGGIGTEIAKYLLERFKARLLLVGRSPLPEKDRWENGLEQQTAVSERIKVYLALEKLGGEIIYEAVDICDLTRLKQVINRARSQWGCELDGVIHLAGIYKECALKEETRDSFAATLCPKVLGTWVISQLLKKHPNSVFIGFSSLISYFGGALVGAYSAANCFLDYLSCYQKNAYSLQSYCFNWSAWDEVGISRDFKGKDLLRAKGYQAISVKQGLHSLLAGLLHSQAWLFVGLEGSNQHIRRHLEKDSYRLQKLYAYFTAQDGYMVFDQLQKLVVRDRFGTRSECDFRQILNMPLLDTGEINRSELIASHKVEDREEADRVPPRNDLERTIASVWQEVLNREKLGVNDNFFDLGGNSLLMAQVNAELKKVLKKDISVTEMFQYPSIGAVAEYLAKTQDLQPSPALGQSQTRGAERRRKIRRRKGYRARH